MKKHLWILPAVAFALSLTSHAGNGIERADLGQGIDWSQSPGINEQVKQAAESAIADRCAYAYKQADSIGLVQANVERKRVDQSVFDVTYDLTFVVRQDSLPPRWVGVQFTHFDANSSNSELRLEALKSFQSSICK